MNWYKKYIIATRKIIIPAKDYNNLMALIEKIARGERNWTPEELELQQEYTEAIEIVLRKKMRATK